MNPFKFGDVVYCVRFGECIVKESRDGMCKLKTESAGECWRFHEELSFTPWPEANHERPIQDGWWVVTESDGTFPLVRKKQGISCFDNGGSFTNHAEHYTFHKFLGDSWK